MTSAHRHLLKWCHTAHVYLTLFGLALILFFAITGFMLNHEDWFVPLEPRTSTAEGIVPTSLLHPVDRLGVVENLRNDFGATGSMNSFREDEESIQVEFVRPGSRVVADIRLADGQTSVQFECRGWAAVMTDLHKGKSAGLAWGLIIDAVCILLLAIGLTGLVLWWSLKSRGKGGLIVILLGLTAAVLVFLWLVP